jgi:hypothetical protein
VTPRIAVVVGSAAGMSRTLVARGHAPPKQVWDQAARCAWLAHEAVGGMYRLT